MNRESKIEYVEALGNLMGGIKKDYAKWGSDIDKLDEPQKSIRLKMIDEFNKNLDIEVVGSLIRLCPMVLFGVLLPKQMDC